MRCPHNQAVHDGSPLPADYVFFVDRDFADGRAAQNGQIWTALVVGCGRYSSYALRVGMAFRISLRGLGQP